MNPSARWKHPLDRDAFSPGRVDRDLRLVLLYWVDGLAEMVWPCSTILIVLSDFNTRRGTDFEYKRSLHLLCLSFSPPSHHHQHLSASLQSLVKHSLRLLFNLWVFFPPSKCSCPPFSSPSWPRSPLLSPLTLEAAATVVVATTAVTTAVVAAAAMVAAPPSLLAPHSCTPKPSAVPLMSLALPT